MTVEEVRVEKVRTQNRLGKARKHKFKAGATKGWKKALVTLNDPQFVEAARHLAERSLKHGTDDASIMNEITQRVLSRSLTPEESTFVNATKSELLKYYQDNPEDAKSLTSVGESRSDENLNTVALAAWTMVCNELMNLDEALNK